MRDAYGYSALNKTQTHLHDGPKNTFIALRVINPELQTDLLYAEFADVTDPHAWTFPDDSIEFSEL